jgi:hypothetical protein
MFTIVTMLIGAPILTFNYIVDPLWLFQHENEWNSIQQGFNERQQKVNKLTYSNKSYDALLLGSSRSTYVNQHHFQGLNVFNFAVSSMYIEEYKGYLDYAKKLNGKPIDYVFLGLDFFATNKYRQIENQAPSFFIDQTNSYLYRFKSLASFETLGKSLEVYRSSKNHSPKFIDHRFYDRKNVATPFPVTNDLIKSRIETNIYNFFEEDEIYEYDPSVINQLKSIVESNPDTKFIVYTTPVTLPRLVVQLQNPEYLSGYKQWLRDLTDVFGEVNHFMDINQVTSSIENFVDSHHFTPEIGSQIIDFIWNTSNSPSDGFGKKINQLNLTTYLAEIEKQLTTNEEFTYDYLKPDSQQPIFTEDFKQNSLNFTSSNWEKDSLPLKLLGRKGEFHIFEDTNHLHIKPSLINRDSTIQIGYELGEISPKLSDNNEVTLIVWLKGQEVSEKGDVQLFIQDQVDNAWDRVAYNTILDEEQTRSFKITKKIRTGSTSVLLGIRWQGIHSQQQSLQIEKIEIY